MTSRRLFVLLSFALFGCSSGASSPANPADSGGSSDGGTDTGVATDGGGDAPSKPALPNDLASFESNGEGIGVAAQAKDWTKAQGILDQATMTWSTLKGVLQKDGAKADALTRIDGALAKLKTDIGGTMAKEAEYDANVVSLTVPDFFDLYAFPVPSEALRLDAWFRELQIDGEYSDFTKAATSLTSSKASWGKLKPATEPKAATRSDIMGATTVVADLDKTLADADAAIAAKSSKSVVDLAQKGLDEVDTVEQVFK